MNHQARPPHQQIKENVMNISDIMVYFRNNIQPGQRQVVEDILHAIDGVIASRFVKDKDNIMIVAYDPEKVQTSYFKDTFSQMGIQGRFVGM